MKEAPRAAPSRESSSESRWLTYFAAEGQIQHSREKLRSEVVDWDEQAEDNPKRQTRQSKLVGQKFGFGIGENQTEQEKPEHAIFQRSQGEPEVGVAAQEKSPGEQLYQEIARRNPGLAMAASAAQEQPTQHRNIVVKRDRLLTLRASRTRRDHR